MSTPSVPVVDYDRIKRLYVAPDPLPFSEYNMGTRICVLLIIFVCVLLLMRWHGKRSQPSLDVRFQRV